MLRLCLLTLLVLGMVSGSCWAKDVTLFDSDSKHPWNVCYQVLSNTGHTELNDDDFLRKASGAVDTLFNAPAESNSRKPIERAVMQREAWRTFDLLAARRQSTAPAHRTLRYRLAKLISLTALTDQEIGEMKGNYTTRPLGNELPRDSINDLELPADLFNPDGEWVQLTHKGINRVALSHESAHGGRSEFLLFVRFPKGQEQAKTYLDDYNRYAGVEAQRRRTVLYRTAHRQLPLPLQPDFPQGLQAILVERMLVLSTRGIPQTTPIILSIAFNDLTPTISERTRMQHRLRSAVFELSVPHLLDTDAVASLRRLESGEPFFGEIPFPKGLQQCAQCHSDKGLNTLHANFSNIVLPDDRSVQITTIQSPSKTPEWKLWQSNYSMLLGYLEALSGADSKEQ